MSLGTQFRNLMTRMVTKKLGGNDWLTHQTEFKHKNIHAEWEPNSQDDWCYPEIYAIVVQVSYTKTCEYLSKIVLM